MLQHTVFRPFEAGRDRGGALGLSPVKSDIFSDPNKYNSHIG